jgi:hypothetical protein
MCFFSCVFLNTKVSHRLLASDDGGGVTRPFVLQVLNINVLCSQTLRPWHLRAHVHRLIESSNSVMLLSVFWILVFLREISGLACAHMSVTKRWSIWSTSKVTRYKAQRLILKCLVHSKSFRQYRRRVSVQIDRRLVQIRDSVLHFVNIKIWLSWIPNPPSRDRAKLVEYWWSMGQRSSLVYTNFNRWLM